MRTSGETGQVTAGTPGVSPAMSAKRENEAACKELRAWGAFAGETPAVPANHLTSFTQLMLRFASAKNQSIIQGLRMASNFCLCGRRNL